MGGGLHFGPDVEHVTDADYTVHTCQAGVLNACWVYEPVRSACAVGSAGAHLPGKCTPARLVHTCQASVLNVCWVYEPVRSAGAVGSAGAHLPGCRNSWR
eukprot:1136697-Pelagomonas_calceolata.AAC.10